MRVALILRHPDAGFSIEKVFSEFIGLKTEDLEIVAVRLPRSRAGLRDLWHNLRFVSQLRGFDVYHVTGDAHYVLLGLLGRTSVLTIHDTVLLDTATSFMRRLLFLALWFLVPAALASQVTCSSPTTGAKFRQYVGFRSPTVIPNPVATTHFDTTPNGFEGRARVLQIGTGWNKNLDRVIESLADLDCELTILGSITPPQQQRLAELNVPVRLLKGLRDDEVRNEYIRTNLVVFVSVYEGFGMPILEAQAHGRPVITSNLEPMASLAGGGALCVDPRDTSAIRSAVVQVFADPALRDRLVEAGRRNVENFRLQRILGQYVKVYEQACRR